MVDTYKYAVAILEEEANLVIRVVWVFKVSLRERTMGALIDTLCNTSICVGKQCARSDIEMKRRT